MKTKVIFLSTLMCLLFSCGDDDDDMVSSNKHCWGYWNATEVNVDGEWVAKSGSFLFLTEDGYYLSNATGSGNYAEECDIRGNEVQCYDSKGNVVSICKFRDITEKNCIVRITKVSNNISTEYKMERDESKDMASNSPSKILKGIWDIDWSEGGTVEFTSSLIKINNGEDTFTGSYEREKKNLFQVNIINNKNEIVYICFLSSLTHSQISFFTAGYLNDPYIRCTKRN